MVYSSIILELMRLDVHVFCKINSHPIHIYWEVSALLTTRIGPWSVWIELQLESLILLGAKGGRSPIISAGTALQKALNSYAPTARITENAPMAHIGCSWMQKIVSGPITGGLERSRRSWARMGRGREKWFLAGEVHVEFLYLFPDWTVPLRHPQIYARYLACLDPRRYFKWVTEHAWYFVCFGGADKNVPTLTNIWPLLDHFVSTECSTLSWALKLQPWKECGLVKTYFCKLILSYFHCWLYSTLNTFFNLCRSLRAWQYFYKPFQGLTLLNIFFNLFCCPILNHWSIY